MSSFSENGWAYTHSYIYREIGEGFFCVVTEVCPSEVVRHVSLLRTDPVRAVLRLVFFFVPPSTEVSVSSSS